MTENSNDNIMDFDRSNTNIKHPEILETENENNFEIECQMSFTSERKRMSILVRDPKDGKLRLYVKGADSEIKKRLKHGA